MVEAFQKVLVIVRRISGARHVAATTRIYHDLSIAGDDACEMLEELASKHGVSFEGFDFRRYFPNEHEALGAHALKTLGLRSDEEALTIQHLADVVERGAWFKPAAV